MASHEELSKWIWLIELACGLATSLWLVLTYRIWDLHKLVSSKVDFEKFDEEIKSLQGEAKNDLRYIEEKMSEQVKDLANDLKQEIRSIK